MLHHFGLGGPGIRAPKLDVGVHSNDEYLALEPGILSKFRRDPDTPLPVELDVRGLSEDHSSECPSIRIADRQARDFFSQRSPGIHRIERQAAIDTTSNDRVGPDEITEARRNGNSAFVIEAVAVTPEKHDITLCLTALLPDSRPVGSRKMPEGTAGDHENRLHSPT